MPARTESVATFKRIAEKFGPGAVAPLAVVIRSDADLSSSAGLALIDDLSRLLGRQNRRLEEVRSATQPLGSPKPLEPARLAARLAAVNEGFTRMAEGSKQLRQGLIEGAAKLQTALQLKRFTGIDLTATPEETGQSLARSLAQASTALLGSRGGQKTTAPPNEVDTPPESTARQPDPQDKPTDPREVLVRELSRAAEGATQIGDGAVRAQKEVTAILNDPVGRRALDRLLITPDTVREHPELRQSFAAYISPDGHYARIDLVQKDRFFSTDAMLQVAALRKLIAEFLVEQNEVPIQHADVAITGANAESADIWAITQRDQVQTWIVVPIGVFLILLIALRDPWTCLNLVATMVLTYLFALGVTHLVFVSWLGAEGIDWKVPLFLFVLLVAVGVDYNIFLMSRLQQEVRTLGLRLGIRRAIAQTGGLITSAAAITACSFAAFLTSPLASIRQLGFALVLGIFVDAVLVRPVLVPCGHWLIHHGREQWQKLRVRTRLFAPHLSVRD
jgi:RND superfamily putative drug exporter